jgi:hypothetical protein
LIGCLLPWSFLLVAYLSRDFRQAIGAARGHALYLACCLAVAVPTVWMAPGGRTRYLMSLYPCVACLAALVIERCWQQGPKAGWRSLGAMMLRILGVAACGAAILMLVIAAIGKTAGPLEQSFSVAVPLAIVSAAAAMVLFWSRKGEDRPAAGASVRRLPGLLSIAVFLATVYVGLGITVQHCRSDLSTQPAVAAVKQRLPRGVSLVSVGRLDHLFTYYYQDMIPTIDPKRLENEPAIEYFCFDRREVSPEAIRVPYEVVATVTCEKYIGDEPRRVVVVARRIGKQFAASGLPLSKKLHRARSQ